MTKRKTPHRAPNFTHKEVETLIYNLELKPELIKPAARLNRDGVANNSASITLNDKLELWEEVAAEINKVGESNVTGIIRSATDVKKKWNDLKSRVKAKADDIRKGRKLSDKTPLSQLEERVLYLIAKTNRLQGLNGALPPAYINILSNGSKDKTMSSSSEPIKPEDVDKPNADIDSNVIQIDTEDIITIKEIPKIVQKIMPPPPTIPATKRIPIITFKAPLNKIIQKPTETRFSKHTVIDSNFMKNVENPNISKDYDTREVIEMISSSQRELRNEIKSIKKIMIRISEQKRKRIQQENEKIQLKKMKLMLKCQKQGVDYDEFITDFM